MILSKFAQKLERNGYVARFNSLKNVPVFYKKEFDGAVEEYIDTGLKSKNVSKEIKEIVEQLEKNKVIVPYNEYDDMILEAINNSFPKPYPSILYLILTEKCNFACDYCFIERYMDQSKTNVMTKEIAKKAIDFYVRQLKTNKELFENEKEVLFYGGEPLSNFDVLKYAAELINKYKEEGVLPKKLRMGMVTNGTFINDEIANELNRLNVSFSISLDGATEKANCCRKYHNGTPGFKNIINGLEVAKRNDCNVGLSMTLSEKALEERDKIFELIDKYDIKSIGFNILLTDKTYSVPEEYFVDVSKFIIEAFKVFREKGVYEDRAMRKVKAFTEHTIHYQDCAAEGGNQLVVAPNGDVGLCQGYLSTRETFVTNVDDLEFDISTDHLFCEWHNRTPLKMPQCLKCVALGTCGGGCAMNAKANGNSIWDLDERFCVHSKSTIEFLIWDLFDIMQKKVSI